VPLIHWLEGNSNGHVRHRDHRRRVRGATLARNLLLWLPADARLAVFEKAEHIGQGVAYSTADPDHRLNVPADKMAVASDAPDHFARWLWRTQRGRDAPGSMPPSDLMYAPRQRFGEYVAEMVEAAAYQRGYDVTFNTFHEEVVDVDPRAGAVTIVMQSGRMIRAEHVVLATGDMAGGGPPLPEGKLDPACADRTIAAPWTPEGRERLSRIEPDDKVLFIGSGLTMVDLAVTLLQGNHQD